MKGHFYFSQKQKDQSKSLYQSGMWDTYRDNYALIDGKEVLYSEMTSLEHGKLKNFNWDDMVYLGEGTYAGPRNVEKRTVPIYNEIEKCEKMLEYCIRMLEQEKLDKWDDVIYEGDDILLDEVLEV